MVKNTAKHNRILCVAAMLLMTVILPGCGVPKAKGDTLAAYEQLEALEYEGALMALDMAEEAGENKALIARARGIACMGLAEYEEALNCFKECLSYSDWRLDEIDFDVNYYMADAYEKTSDYVSAVQTYTAILDLKEKEVLAHYKRGVDYLILNDHDAAVEDFNRALELAPDDYDLRIEIAGRLSETGYEEEGKRYLEDFLAEKEKKLSDYDKGRIYFYLDDFESAKSYFEDARDEDDQNTILFLGKTYEMLGDYNYATSTYQNYLTKHPEAAIIYNQLGMARIQSGDYAGAKDAFSTAKSLGNTGIDQTLAFNEIVASEYTGDFQTARNLMDGYLKKYPDDQEAIRENIFLSTR